MVRDNMLWHAGTLVVCQILVMACGTTLATSGTRPSDAGARTGVDVEVTRVIDGDTVEVVFLFGPTDMVRLLGVDTPDTFAANRPDEFGAITDTDCLDEWGSLATDFVARMLQGQSAIKPAVTLIKDPATGERGFYGRLLAYIHVDDQDFNATLVEQGYARVYTEGESSREGDYLRLEERAREQQIGLWGCEAG
jgi:micrococcal nuclease